MGYSLNDQHRSTSCDIDDTKDDHDDDDEITSNIAIGYKRSDSISISDADHHHTLHIDISRMSQDISEIILDDSFDKEISALNLENETEPTLHAPTTTTTTKKNKKKKKSKKNHGKRRSGTSYYPNTSLRAQGNIQISKQFTETIIPSTIRENIGNIYGFMDKYTAICHQLQQHSHSNNALSKIFNYGFHHRLSGEPLYCYLERQDLAVNAARGYQWKMRAELYTAEMLKLSFNIHANELPKSFGQTQMFREYKEHQIILQKLLLDEKKIHSLIQNTAWHKIEIYNKVWLI